MNLFLAPLAIVSILAGMTNAPAYVKRLWIGLVGEHMTRVPSHAFSFASGEPTKFAAMQELLNSNETEA